MVKCKICKKQFGVITNTHLKASHNTTIKKYRKKFGPEGTAFAESISEIPKDDPRYLTWRKSLSKRPPSWNKDHTKSTHSSVAKISKTFKRKKIDNFAEWRRENPVIHEPLAKNKETAFLIGMILGDGNIHKLKRVDQLTITLGTDKPDLWKYTASIVERVFKKTPTIQKNKKSACVAIRLYRKNISRDIGIPQGSRRWKTIKLPRWILSDRNYLIECLRGLYEAEASFNIHKPTYTYKLIFSNKNDTLLEIVYNALVKLGFHPHMSKYKVQISKKDEVFALKELLRFRQYPKNLK